MIREVHIENYKSIQKLKLGLGRVTVLIGENGSGKSNILEAIALASAAANDKLDNEFLVSRGIRVTEPQLMRSAFEREHITQKIRIYFLDDNQVSCEFLLQNDNEPYSNWFFDRGEKVDLKFYLSEFQFAIDTVAEAIESGSTHQDPDLLKSVVDTVAEAIESRLTHDLGEKIAQLSRKMRKTNIDILGLHHFLIYSPEYHSLRIFQEEGQIQPLGIKGEGLFKLLKVLSLDENREKINQIKQKIQLIDWFEDFEIPHDLYETEKSLKIKDRYLDSELAYFDQRSSNEGFLFLLFYFALFISDDTPKFFAIDNIDASLNPKLCSKLIKELVTLAKEHDKQAIFTTHNPAVLDGLNLDDDEQRLLVIYRNKFGHTKARRIEKPTPLEGQEPVKLSEAFLRGYIGGLPKNF